MKYAIVGLTGLIEFFRELEEKKGFFVDDMFVGFDMNWAAPSKHECGTACCIGGWIKLLRPDIDELVTTECELAGYLGARVVLLAKEEGISIDHGDALEICYPDVKTGAYNASPTHAAVALECLKDGMDAGEAWKRAMNYGL